jgi:pimeloyl-ACP methyl ester carboxylesterase
MQLGKTAVKAGRRGLPPGPHQQHHPLSIQPAAGGRVSDQAWRNSFYVAISTSAHAALRCVTACREDFRGNLAAISVPVLVIQGDQDRVLPYEATGGRLPALLSTARSVVIAGGPHAIIWTQADEVNRALLDFIGDPGQAARRFCECATTNRSDKRT